MFQTFDIAGHGGVVEFQQSQELREHAAAAKLTLGLARASFGESEAAITLVTKEAALSQLLHPRRHAGTAYAQSGGDVRDAGVAFRSNQFGDAGQTILGAGRQGSW